MASWRLSRLTARPEWSPECLVLGTSAFYIVFTHIPQLLRLTVPRAGHLNETFMGHSHKKGQL